MRHRTLFTLAALFALAVPSATLTAAPVETAVHRSPIAPQATVITPVADSIEPMTSMTQCLSTVDAATVTIAEPLPSGSRYPTHHAAQPPIDAAPLLEPDSVTARALRQPLNRTPVVSRFRSDARKASQIAYPLRR